jgi:LmbE family N-acetylglucosaminyl deacetylase
MNPYQTFITELARLFRQSATLPLGGFTAPPSPPAAPSAPKALVFSPHPDDEVVMGGLPLRLQRELHWNVCNVAVTQGSNKARQLERLKELQECCAYLGFGLIQTSERGLEGVKLETREKAPSEWGRAVARLAEILSQERPRAIFFPHDDDWNSTHIGTHHLVADALRQFEHDFTCLTVETEFWGAMDTPNLLIESSEQDVIDLVTALTFHVGEVKRNPYHLRLPAWLMDNVRRGGELVGGQGGTPPGFLFGTLYRLRRWQDGKFETVLDRGRFVSRTEDLLGLF